MSRQVVIHVCGGLSGHYGWTSLHWRCYSSCCCGKLLTCAGLSAACGKHNNEVIAIQPLGGMWLRPCGAAAVAVSRLWFTHQAHPQNLIWGQQVCYTVTVPSDRKKDINPANNKWCWWKRASRSTITLQGPRYPARSYRDFYWSSSQAHSRTSPFIHILCWWICLCRRSKKPSLFRTNISHNKVHSQSVFSHFKAGTSE